MTPVHGLAAWDILPLGLSVTAPFDNSMDLNPFNNRAAQRSVMALPAVVAFVMTLIVWAFFSDNRIDSSSPKSFRASFDLVRSELDPEQQKLFDEGVAEIRRSVSESGLARDTAALETISKDQLDGMTANQVIARAKQLRRIRQEKIERVFGRGPKSDD